MAGFTSWSEIAPLERDPGRSLKAVTTDLITVARVEHVGPTEHLPHVHDDVDQVMVVLEGEIEFTIGNERRLMGPGDLAIIPHGVSHGAKVAAGQHCVTLEAFSPPRPELVPDRE